MRAYVITTGLVFFLLMVAHIWRVFLERHLATDPFFVVATVVAAALAIWAVVLLRRS